MAEICDQNFDVLCRLCLKLIDGDFVPIFDNDPIYHAASVKDKIYFITDILVSSEDRLPAQICGMCDDRVNDCYNFKQQSAINNMKLMEYIQQHPDFIKKQPQAMNSPRFHKRSQTSAENDNSQFGHSKIHPRTPKSTLTNGNHLSPGKIHSRKRLGDHFDSTADEESSEGSRRELSEVTATRVAVMRAGKMKRMTDKQEYPITNNDGSVMHDVDKVKPLQEEETADGHDKLDQTKLKKSRVLWTMRTRGKAQKRFLALGHHLRPSRQEDSETTDDDDIFKYLRLNQVSRIENLKKEYEENASREEDSTPTTKERKCPECGEKFPTLPDLRDHKRATGHTIPGCKICGKTFLSLEVRDNHVLKKHKAGNRPKLKKTTKERKCHECGEVFESLPELRAHQNKQGHRLAPVCKICGIIYKSFEAREKHVIKRHKGKVENAAKPRFLCNICNKTFKTKAHLTNHLNQHSFAGVKKYACELCDDRFYTTADLRVHFEAKHDTDTQLFQCLFCDATLSSSKALRSHFNRLHKVISRKVELKYTCAICLDMFATKITLNTHIRTHKGEKFILNPHRLQKLYECEVCGESFKLSSMRKSHVMKCHKVEPEVDRKDITLKKVQVRIVDGRTNKKKMKKHTFMEVADM